MSKSYKIVFLVRFLGYSLFLSGIFGVIFILGPFIQAEIGYRKDRILGIQRRVSYHTSGAEIQMPLPSPQDASESFGNIVASENIIEPTSTEYGIVIEKINANAKIIRGVNPVNEREYVKALQSGVAEALGSTPPGQPGNLYLFSHSTDAPWNIVRLNAVFYLLKELEAGDRVIVFYKNKRYDYIVFDKTTVEPGEVSFLTNTYDVPVLTLQTCDPPGTLLRRLVVRAKLVSS